MSLPVIGQIVSGLQTGIRLATRVRVLFACRTSFGLLYVRWPCGTGPQVFGVSSMSQLSNVAMLADFSVSKPDFRKIDKERSAELTDNAGAVRKSAHVSKKLIMSDTLV